MSVLRAVEEAQERAHAGPGQDNSPRGLRGSGIGREGGADPLARPSPNSRTVNNVP